MSIKLRILVFMIFGAFFIAPISNDSFAQGQKKRQRKKKGMMQKERGSTNAQYQAPYGMAGCGLGSLIIKEDGKIQIIAATTNGTGVQTFAITTGSSNCKLVKEDLAQAEQEVFISSNLASLTKDAARGDGEYLYNLSEVMGCNEGGHYEVFAALSQQNFGDVFSDTDAARIRNRYVSIISNDETLAKACSRVVAKG